MNTMKTLLTVWIRVSPDSSSLYDHLVSAVGEAPFESTEMDGVRDMQWSVGSTNDALAEADRLKPLCDDPALILLKVTTYYAGGSVDSVTFKDQRAELRPAGLDSPQRPAPHQAETMSARDALHKQIETAGYRVEGSHDGLSDRDDGSITVTATQQATGNSHTVTVQTQGVTGEWEALQQLTVVLGLDENS